MKTFAVLALVGAALAAPSAVTSAIAPAGTIPAGCSETYSGEFEISIVNASTVSKRALQARTALTITLQDGVLTDAEGRTGYIASNDQFQFDKPAQDGAIYTSGWSVCSNGTLALGSSAIFYECLSGTFYNLYDESQGAQCTAIFIDIVPVSSGSTTTSAASSAAVSQISDGQIQATTSTAAVVSQISDGQIQATTATAVVVSQISDGQIQATTATSAVVVSQISDGQIQATTATAAVTTPAVVSQISDGQIQATAGAASSTGAVVSQISDGQIQAATNGTSATIASATLSASVSVYTGAAALPTMKTELFGLAAGVMALAML